MCSPTPGSLACFTRGKLIGTLLTVHIGVVNCERIALCEGELLPMFAINGTFGCNTWNADTYVEANWDDNAEAWVFWLTVTAVKDDGAGMLCIGGAYTVYPRNGVPVLNWWVSAPEPELDETGREWERKDENCAATWPPAWVRVAGDCVLLVIDT